MKTIVRSAQLLAAALCFTLNSVHGAVFNFSYTFGDGVTATGSLTGTQNGQFVDNVAGVSLFLNGVQASGSIFGSKYDPSTFSYSAGPIVSFDALQSNFVFSNSELAAGDFTYDSLFYITKPTVAGTASAVGYSPAQGVFGSQDDPAVNRRWSLTLSTTGSSVPDSGATIALLGMALFGAVWLRRKQS